MKFECPACGKILFRRMKTKADKMFLTKGGKYRSMCDKTGRDVLCRRVKYSIRRTEPKL